MKLRKVIMSAIYIVRTFFFFLRKGFISLELGTAWIWNIVFPTIKY